MSRLRFLSVAALLAVAANAHASSFIVTTDSVVRALKATSDATTDVVSSSFKDNKIVREARDDAASFVASEGGIRGVKLESALDYIRHQSPQLNASDAQLAQAILTI
ncbi:DUF2388 domain-containing protein [Pseudomonas sp. P154a]|uniref:DUF2388 domain-containing protein n=1 Tax=Pseudomonas mucoides TaxID=2730424 RepID=UPI0018927880|nr:DUF2388 domain-containing protein [Pseudomonas mucoides]MBF6040925.1 DUF2388 domain-containing protein [Pseudomonas mucoides]